MSETKKTVSIIIIYTNDNQINECKKWIEVQDFDGQIELIIINNKNNALFTSASKALNSGASNSKGDYLIFMHQDIYLWDKASISKVVEFLSSNKNDIVGVAGIALEDNQTHFDIEMKIKGKQYAWSTGGKPMKAHTLDECFLAMTKKKWEELKFDEVTCDDWHFYGADICMSNTMYGFSNYIFPLKICHDSYGSLDTDSFKNAAIKIANKYNGKFEYLYTTCIQCKCNKKKVVSFIRKRKFKAKIKKALKVLGLFKIAEAINNRRKRKKGLFIVEED